MMKTSRAGLIGVYMYMIHHLCQKHDASAEAFQLNRVQCGIRMIRAASSSKKLAGMTSSPM